MRDFFRTIQWFLLYPFSLLSNDTKAVVLMYHSINLPQAYFNISPRMFEWHCKYLKQKKYNCISLQEMLNRLENKETLNRIVVLTFDDGHTDFVTHVLPILEKYNLPATLFWPTRVPNSTLTTSEKIACPLLTQTEIESLLKHPLISFGSHGVTHRELFVLPADEILYELTESKKTLEILTNSPIDILAYPRGKFASKVAVLAKQVGYRAAVGVEEERISSATALFDIPRISIDRTVSKQGFIVKLSPIYILYRRIYQWITIFLFNSVSIFIRAMFRRESIYRMLFNYKVRKRCAGLEGKVLDIGSGLVPSYYRLLPKQASYTRTDFRESEEVKKLDFNQTFPFDDKLFDAILFFNALYIAEDPEKTLREIHRVLAPGGKLYLVTPFVANEMPEPHDYARFTAEGLEKLFQNSQFEVASKARFGERFSSAVYVLNPIFSFFPFNLFFYPLAILLDECIPRRVRQNHPLPLGYFYTLVRKEEKL